MPMAGLVAGAAIPGMHGAGLGMFLGGMGASALGGILGAKAANPKLTPVPPPAPVFPWLNQAYLSNLLPAGTQGLNTLQQTAATGNPVDVMPSYEAMRAASQRTRDESRANILENLPAYGSTRATALTDFETQSSKDFTQVLADLFRQMNESAAGRSLSAANMLSQLYSGSAMTLAPTAALTTGGQSPLGAGLSSAGSGLQQIAMLKAFGII